MSIPFSFVNVSFESTVTTMEETVYDYVEVQSKERYCSVCKKRYMEHTFCPYCGGKVKTRIETCKNPVSKTERVPLEDVMFCFVACTPLTKKCWLCNKTVYEEDYHYCVHCGNALVDFLDQEHTLTKIFTFPNKNSYIEPSLFPFLLKGKTNNMGDIYTQQNEEEVTVYTANGCSQGETKGLLGRFYNAGSRDSLWKVSFNEHTEVYIFSQFRMIGSPSFIKRSLK